MQSTNLKKPEDNYSLKTPGSDCQAFFLLHQSYNLIYREYPSPHIFILPNRFLLVQR